jgi:hypothetical protein
MGGVGAVVTAMFAERHAAHARLVRVAVLDVRGEREAPGHGEERRAALRFLEALEEGDITGQPARFEGEPRARDADRAQVGQRRLGQGEVVPTVRQFMAEEGGIIPPEQRGGDHSETRGGRSSRGWSGRPQRLARCAHLPGDRRRCPRQGRPGAGRSPPGATRPLARERESMWRCYAARSITRPTKAACLPGCTAVPILTATTLRAMLRQCHF